MKMADSQEDGDQKLRIFAYLDVVVTTLSITIGLYSRYCFIYRNKHFACQWPFKVFSKAEIAMKKGLQIPLIGMPVVDNRNGCANVYQSTHTWMCTHTGTHSVHTFYSSLGFRMLLFVCVEGWGLFHT